MRHCHLRHTSQCTQCGGVDRQAGYLPRCGCCGERIARGRAVYGWDGEALCPACARYSDESALT